MNIYKQIFETNTDLLKRLNQKNLEAKYLKNEDVFLLRLDKTVVTYDSIDLDDFMTIHYDPETFKIIGFTIPYVKEFSKHMSLLLQMKKEKEKELSEEPKPRAIATAGLTGLALAY